MVTESPVVIVGSGPTAAAAATQLASRGVRCTVVNDGRLVPPGLVLRIAGRTLYRRDPEVGLVLHEDLDAGTVWFVTSALGGLSNYWTAACPRFDPDDFEVHSRVDEAHRWPVTYAELSVWYDAAERLLALTGATEPEWRGRTVEVAHTRSTPRDWQEVMRSLSHSTDSSPPPRSADRT